jgi:mannose-6-phosphate isomerase-like protein (cupin superfamily)
LCAGLLRDDDRESVAEMKTIERYTPRGLTREWGLELFIAETPHYLGKVLTMTAGTKGGLQAHSEKDETFHLLAGEALVRYDDGTGKLIAQVMQPGESFHIPPGAPHQVEAIKDCVLLEASTPHYDDRIRLEAHYGLPDGGGLPTTR